MAGDTSNVKNIRNILWSVLCALLVGACGGGGANGQAEQASPPPTVVSGLSLAGPDYGAALNATECGTAAGTARQARYPGSIHAGGPTGVLRPPLTMRSDRQGGLVLAQDEGPGLANLYRINARGDKILLTPAATRVFDVSPDGLIWLAITAGAFGYETLDGVATGIVNQQGYTGVPQNGSLDQVPLGFVSLIGAARDRVYLLAAPSVDRLLSHEDEYLRGPLTTASGFALRVLTRNQSNGWNIQTLPLPSGIPDAFYIRGIRVDAAGNLVVLVDQPYKHPLGIAQDGRSSLYNGEAAVWTRTVNGDWSLIASKTYASSNYTGPVGFIGPRGVDSRAIEVDDLTVGADGRIWVGGGFGAIWSVSREGGWTPVAQLDGHTEEQIGVDDPLSQATFANAFQVTAMPDGLLFYDASTCQIRRLAGDQLATFSGPVLSAVPTLGNRRLLGIASGKVLFSNVLTDPLPSGIGTGPWLGSFDLATGEVRPLNSRGPVSQNESEQRCGASLGASGFYAPGPCLYGYVDPTAKSPWTWIGVDGATPIYGSFPPPSGVPVALYAWQGPGSSRLLSNAATWPGVGGAGNATSGPADFHVVNGHAYMFGLVRTLTLAREMRIYDIDLSSGQAVPVAGKTLDSAIFQADLSPVMPTADGNPVFVQRRHDGGYWLANVKEVWLLDKNGVLSRIAGAVTTGNVGIDATGSAASFAYINRIRVLPDDRLLVVDTVAHAVRLVDQNGTVSTIVGRLNQPGWAPGALPGLIAAPLDALLNGHDVLISTRDSPNLVVARGVI